MTENYLLLAQGQSIDEAFKTGFDSLKTEVFQSSGSLFESNVVIVIDVPCPESFPTMINPSSLSALIHHLRRNGAEDLKVVLSCYSYFSDQRLLTAFGLDLFLKSLGVEFVSCDATQAWVEYRVDDDVVEIPKAVAEGSQLVVLTQVKADVYFDLYGSLLALSRIIKRGSEEVSFAEKWWMITNLCQEKKALIVNDSFFFSPNAGPLMTARSAVQETKFLVFGNQPYLADLCLFKCLGLKNINLKFQKILTKAKLLLNADDIPFKGVVLEDIRQNYSPFSSPLAHIFEEGPALCVGDVQHDAAYNLALLLLKMDAIMAKDLFHVREKYPAGTFVIGSESPEPEEKKNLYLFGDAAIQRAKVLNLYQVPKLKKVKTEEKIKELDFNAEIKLDNKIDKQKEKFEEKKEKIMQKEDEKEIEQLLAEAKVKHKKKIEKLKRKTARKIEKRHEKQEKRKKYNENPKIKSNKHLLEIPGSAPETYDAMEQLANYHNKKAPALHAYVQVISKFKHVPADEEEPQESLEKIPSSADTRDEELIQSPQENEPLEVTQQ